MRSSLFTLSYIVRFICADLLSGFHVSPIQFCGMGIPGTAFIVPLIIINGNLDQLTDTNTSNNPEVYEAYLGANTDGFDHIRLLADNTFRFEDLPNGGNLYYNDLIVKVNFTV